jgi:drug/metabolite transporter (DMT)-like permease
MRRLSGETLAVLAALMFVGLELSIRAAAPGVPPVAGTLIRLVPILALAWFRTLTHPGCRRGLRQVFRQGSATRRLALQLALLADGVLNLFLGNALKLAALKAGGIVVTLTAVEVGNLFSAALLVRWLLGRAVSPPAFMGLAVAAVGTGLASFTGTLSGPPVSAVADALGAGVAFGGAMAAMGYAVGQGIGVWPALAVSSTWGALVTVLAAGPAGIHAATVVPAGAALALLLSGAFYAAALACLTAALIRLPVVSTDTIVAANGPAAALVGAVWFGGRVTLPVVVGLALVAFGAVWVRRHDPRPADAAPSALPASGPR